MTEKFVQQEHFHTNGEIIYQSLFIQDNNNMIALQWPI